MTDLVARVVAAIQQVRQQMPHAKDCGEGAEIEWEAMDGEARKACTCDWAVRVDARLAVCVEASWSAVDIQARADESFDTVHEAGLAAFLAAATQKEET